ncbi:MAG: RNA-directed DNA polymerase [Candidatus Competibacter sp.]|nr:RNA-directed DNA polymerase [Candidatus Competibacter sp.]
MSIIQTKYQQLSPRGAFLTDVVVLAQAWKKAHAYIRRHNWYADVLELDCSVIDLERRLAEWAAAIASDAFAPDHMMLVPAPKNARWDFPNLPGKNSDEKFEAWGVAKNQQGERIQKLRPLAHLSIRDQSLATAVMLCLADAVESAQGDTSERNGLKAQQQGVFSYGNRLHCRWDSSARPRPRAFFSWGNSHTYSRYFQDYRTFLARPRGVCADLSARLAAGRELYIVSLDIKSFFDCIDRSALIRQLQMLYGEFAKDFGLPEEFHADEDFWRKAEQVFRWRWRQDDRQLAPLLNGTDSLPTGLPQGLIASGFFANAYMVGFDRLLGAAINVDDSAAGFRIRDYCRYVDDIRLVVEAGSQHDAGVLAAKVQHFVSKLLQKHCEALGADKELTLNPDKMTATPYRSTSAQSNLSALMEMLQEATSGTFDLDSLTQAAGGLDGLLWMSEQLEDPQSRKTSSLQLANIAVPNTDVRDDTVKRFVATRIASALRMRLAMTDTEGAPDWGDAVNDEANASMAFSHEFEATARKLIKCWADNPALALLLRVGLDLFPHPRLLGPVLDALQCKLYLPPAIEDDLTAPEVPVAEYKDDVTARREILVAEYVAADLLRAGAMETGYRDDAEYPDAIEIGKYRQELAAFARRILLERNQSPWYLKQQALLFLASVGDHSVAAAGEDALESYRRLHQSLLYFPCKDSELEKTLPLSLVGQQLAPDPDRFAAWLVESLRSTKEPEVAKHCVLTVALNRPDLMLLALKTRSGRAASWKQFVPSSLRSLRSTPSRRALHLISGAFLPLRCVISDRFNPFAQENALIALANALLGAPDIELALGAGLHVGQIEICCKDWSRIQALPDEADFLNIQFQPGAEADPLYERPAWVDEQAAWLYGLGRILRSCITGEFDFTAGRYLATEEVSRYTGLRSTWFKRRFGLLNTARGLLDEPAPVSSWLSSLLSVLLRWPGTDIKGASAAKLASAKTRVELLEAIHDRIVEQRLLYGERSGAPMYVVQTQEDRELVERPIRIAVVQPMLPRRDQFNDKEPCRWTEKLMAQHRRHLAEVCRLTYQKLRTWVTAQYPRNEGNNRIEPLVDLILFPELSVHPEHVFHLRVLSDKVKATIFAGLTFIDSPKHLAPINQALWLIRTDTPGGDRTFQYAWQGKKHLTKPEEKMGVKSYRPHQVLVEFPIGIGTPTRVAGAICYDATDLALVADLRERSDIFLVAALNQDVQTFDNMVAALHFHMYQPVVLANMGEFGGSTAQVPLLKHERLIAHIHGNNQVAVSVFEIDPTPFKLVAKPKPAQDLKTPPAGYKGRPLY